MNAAASSRHSSPTAASLVLQLPQPRNPAPQLTCCTSALCTRAAMLPSCRCPGEPQGSSSSVDLLHVRAVHARHHASLPQPLLLAACVQVRGRGGQHAVAVEAERDLDARRAAGAWRVRGGANSCVLSCYKSTRSCTAKRLMQARAEGIGGVPRWR